MEREPDTSHDDQFLTIALSELREGGVAEHPEAAALVDEFVRRNVRPMQ